MQDKNARISWPPEGGQNNNQFLVVIMKAIAQKRSICTLCFFNIT